MSARLVNLVQLRATNVKQKDRQVIVYTKGRIYEGELVRNDAQAGTVEIKFKDPTTHEIWRVLIDVDHIEAISPRWEAAA